MVGAVRRVEGRPRRLGRDPLRLPRRRRDRASLRQQRLPLHGRRRARPAARAGDRTHRQLVEPGALRQADRPALGTGDRSRAPAGRPPRRLHLPPDVPLRADLRLRDGRGAPAARPPLPLQASGAVRALRERLHVWPLLRGAAANRSVAPHRGAAAERLGVDRRVRAVDRVLHLVAVLPSGPPRAPAAAAAHDGARDGDSPRPPLRAYPAWAKASRAAWAFLKAIRPLASWSRARWFASFFDQRSRIARLRLSHEWQASTTQRRPRQPGRRALRSISSPRLRM